MSIADIDEPDGLQPSVRRHRENLASLVASPKSAGGDDTRIEMSVDIVVHSVRTEMRGVIQCHPTIP